MGDITSWLTGILISKATVDENFGGCTTSYIGDFQNPGVNRQRLRTYEFGIINYI